jgi:hypothetical protein
LRHAPSAAASRYTVCAIQRPESQIQCFKEIADISDSPAIVTYSRIIDDQSPVIHTDFVPIVANNDDRISLPDIIIVHRDGTVRRISGDLQEVRWTCSSVPKADQRVLPPEVIFAHWVRHADASTALLRKRDDILRECPASRSSFLVLVYRDGDHQESGLRNGVCEVPTNLRNGLTSARSTRWLRLLVSNPIPGSERWSSAQNLQINLCARSARLSISATNVLINYDLSAFVPEVIFNLALDEGHSSLYPLTASLAAGALRAAIQIYDMKYQSIQDRHELITKTRSRGTDDSARKAVRFISYFAKINVLVAVRGRNLISFTIGRTRTKGGSTFRRQGLLIDSLGHSAYGARRVNTLADAELRPGFSKAVFPPNLLEQAGWEARQKILNDLVLENEADEFERKMTFELRNSAAAGANQLIEASSISLPSDGHFMNHDKIRYLLSKIFHAFPNPSAVGDGQEEINLDVAFFPPNLFKWLARHSHLTTFEIERALSSQMPHLRLQPGAVPRSIMGQDPSLSLLADYLQGENLVGLDETLMVVKLLIIDAVAKAQRASPFEQLFLKESQSMALDEPIANQREAPYCDSQLDAAASGWSTECATAMNGTLGKLNGFSPSKVTSVIRAHLSTEESLALIQYLRQQIFRSGFTSSFPSFSSTSDDTGLPLETTASVLSSCMDALGPLGFLGTFDGGMWEGLVPDLRGEISLALGGLEEATYLKGVLQEMVRYGNQVTSTEDLTAEPLTKLSGNLGSKAEIIMSVYAEPAEERGRDHHEPSALLPLSLKAENAVTRSKKRKGGGEVVGRSGRELQYLKNRNVGRYSFERLVL